MTPKPCSERLRQGIGGLPKVAVAVSGGVDSMTLAHVTHRTLGERSEILHAVSPAVPPRATARVREYAAFEGWRLKVFNAGEFSDPRYMANPVNRCFFCKRNLYLAMRALVDGVIFSGTNQDDLGDFRPGLIAATENGVRHPFVEAEIDKAGVRALALWLGLTDLSELPSSPCLSSRIETGIRIDAEALGAVDRVEELLRQRIQPRTVRCRVRKMAIEVELDALTLRGLSGDHRQRLSAEVRQIFRAIGIDREPNFTSYRQGSAFLTDQPDV